MYAPFASFDRLVAVLAAQVASVIVLTGRRFVKATCTDAKIGP